MLSSPLSLDHIPGEAFLIDCLQKNIGLVVNGKNIKRGKLLLFKRFHFFIQLTLCTEKGTKENVDIPIPFYIEEHLDEGLLYFDYRLNTLKVNSFPHMTNKVSSVYFDNILEVCIVNTLTPDKWTVL